MVADAVGRTPPSIYLHFDNKDDLIRAVCERRFDDLTERFTSDLDGIDDPIERIGIMAHAYVRFAAENPEPYRVLFLSKARQRDTEDLTLVTCFSMLLDAVQHAIDRGRFQPGDASLMSLSLWSGVHGIASLAISHEQHETWPSLEDQVDQYLAQNLHGLLVR